jgi:hypothetical protein
MSHYHGMFDVVHARSSANGVSWTIIPPYVLIKLISLGY